jgi:hypothetical protein
MVIGWGLWGLHHLQLEGYICTYYEPILGIVLEMPWFINKQGPRSICQGFVFSVSTES